MDYTNFLISAILRFYVRTQKISHVKIEYRLIKVTENEIK